MPHWLSRFLFLLEPERAHACVKAAAKLSPLTLLPKFGGHHDQRLSCKLGTLTLKNPVGLAAGFDKTGELAGFLLALGFGHLEVGSITALPCAGNPKPRVFRLPEDHSLINRMGLPGPGVEHFIRTKNIHLQKSGCWINVAKTPEFAGGPKNSDESILDYLATMRVVAPLTPVITINLSCPNSGDGKLFEDEALLTPLLQAIMTEKKDWSARPLLFAKLSPDTSATAFKKSVEILLAQGIDGLVLTNTTTSREKLNTPVHRLANIGNGGLSGAALARISLERLQLAREITAADFPVISVGGVATSRDVLQRLVAGANAVQIYTGFIYGGPFLVKKILHELSAMLDQHKLAGLDEIRGQKKWAQL